jgi:hypothetical protein
MRSGRSATASTSPRAFLSVAGRSSSSTASAGTTAVGSNIASSFLADGFSASLSGFYYRTEGIRENNDLRRRGLDAITQFGITRAASVLMEYRFTDRNSGDTTLRFFPESFSSLLASEEERRQYRVGGRFEVAPGATLVAQWTRETAHPSDDQGPVATFAVTQGDLGEAAGYFNGNGWAAFAGAGYFITHIEAFDRVFDLRFRPRTASFGTATLISTEPGRLGPRSRSRRRSATTISRARSSTASG